jgi:hypothetical protein
MKHWVLTEEKLDESSARLEHTFYRLLRCLAQESGVSELSAQTFTKLLKLFKTTALHEL